MMRFKNLILKIFCPLRLSLSLVLSVLLCSSTYAADAINTLSISSVKEVLTPATTNVFRRHQAPAEDMFNFYGKALGYSFLATYDVGNGSGVSNFTIGQTLLKLTAQEPEWEYQTGGINDVTGLRLLTFNFPSEQVLQQQFIDYGFEPPQFQTVAGRTSALIQDPDNQWVELVINPDQPAEYYQQVEVGLTVSNMQASRQFYKDFIGLQDIGASQDHLFPIQRHQFRRGALTITLRQFAETLPADTGSAGIQYIVNDAHAVEALARNNNVQIDTPTYVLEGFNMNFLWLADPDGIINYFAQTGAR